MNAAAFGPLPGVYDMPADVYHADPVPGGSLSASGAKRLLSPSCPALFHYWRTHTPPAKKAFDVGHAAHKLVLGIGPEIVGVADEWGKDPNEWRTDKVKALLQATRDRGAVPVKPAELEQIEAMAAALRGHEFAGKLFEPGTGQAEKTLIWVDQDTGVRRRARLDWLPDSSGDRIIVPDYKSTRSASLEHLRRAVWDYGYYMQAPWYLDAVRAVWDVDCDLAFVFVAQDKDPPYLVTTFELDPIALQAGRARNRQALEVYRDCTAAEVWPGYTRDVEMLGLPPWAERQLTEEMW